MQGDAERLGGLIDNLLTAGRLEHKRETLNRRLENISQALENYLSREQQSFPANGSLSWRIEPELFARVDLEGLRTAMRNLLENAILYTDGPPQVNIELKREDRLAHLIFADQGRGIEPHERKKVFKMFYRIRRGDRTIRGSGLGLYIVRNIIRLHGGKVWLESAGSGKGTAFHLQIPLSGKGAVNG